LLCVREKYEDDTERLLRDLANGVPISLLAAPAVINNFADYRQLFGYLKSLGIRSFHNVLLRADITIWAYVELMRQDKHACFISSPCAAVSAHIRRHLPALQPFLMPVHSPLLCAMIYLRKYRQHNDRLAFLSPCIAKREEMRSAGQSGYNVTIGRLKQVIASQGVDLSGYAAVDFDDQTEGSGMTLGAYGGICECIAPHLPDGRFMKISGPGVYPWLRNYEQAVQAGQELPTLVEIYNCAAGCEGGTGIGGGQRTACKTVAPLACGIAAKPNPEATERLFAGFRQRLRLLDFSWGSV
jgi:hypothetical protein